MSDPDPVCRWSIAGVVHLVERDPCAALGLIRDRLREENDFEVGATLVTQLGRFSAKYPDLVDEALYDAAFDDWLLPFYDEDSQVDYAFADGFVNTVLRLALVDGTPHAGSLAQSWFEDPWASRVCERAIILVRGFLSQENGEVRSRAFALLFLAVDAAERARVAVDPASEEFRKAFKVVASVCTTVRLASGAFRGQSNQETPPPQGYLEHTLPLFHRVSDFREPVIVHDIVETLAHLAPQGPGAALLCLRGFVGQGERYSYDGLAEKATTSLCARYLSEFWENLVDNEELLAALREVLSAFVHAGWPSAVELSRCLGDAFR